MNTQLISTTELQRNFRKVLANLHDSEVPVVVLRDSKPAAVMLKFAEYQRLLTLEKNTLKKHMESILSHLEKTNEKISDDEVNADIMQARHASRNN